MSIRFSCTECDTHLKVSDDKAGSRGKCPNCGSPIVVPVPEAAEPFETEPLETDSFPPDPWMTDDSELLDGPVEGSPPPRHTKRRRSSAGAVPAGYRAAPTLTTVTAVMIGAILLFDLGLTIISVVQFAELQNVPPNQAVDDIPLSGADLVMVGLFLLRVPTYIACTVCFLMWTHRANTNAAALVGHPLEISPGWSVGWYFIPIANLFKPYQAMKEIWIASSRDDDSTGLVSLWWSLWVFSNIANQAAFRFGFAADTVEKARTSTLLDIGVGLIDLPLSVVAIMLVRRVYAMQDSSTRSSPIRSS